MPVIRAGGEVPSPWAGVMGWAAETGTWTGGPRDPSHHGYGVTRATHDFHMSGVPGRPVGSAHFQACV